MPDYQLGKIYKIVDNTNGNIYVGSTTRPTLAMRLAKHVSNCKSWKDGKRTFTTSFKIIENQNYDIVLLEKYPCDSKDELHKRERHYIETLNCVNKYVVGRTRQEYRQIHKDQKKDYDKDYREKNKEKITLQKSEYYQNNKEKISEREKIKCICPCGKTYRRSDKSQHEKTKFHQNFINSQEQN